MHLQNIVFTSLVKDKWMNGYKDEQTGGAQKASACQYDKVEA